MRIVSQFELLQQPGVNALRWTDHYVVLVIWGAENPCYGSNPAEDLAVCLAAALAVLVAGPGGLKICSEQKLA